MKLNSQSVLRPKWVSKEPCQSVSKLFKYIFLNCVCCKVCAVLCVIHILFSQYCSIPIHAKCPFLPAAHRFATVSMSYMDAFHVFFVLTCQQIIRALHCQVLRRSMSFIVCLCSAYSYIADISVFMMISSKSLLYMYDC